MNVRREGGMGGEGKREREREREREGVHSSDSPAQLGALPVSSIRCASWRACRWPPPSVRPPHDPPADSATPLVAMETADNKV